MSKFLKIFTTIAEIFCAIIPILSSFKDSSPDSNDTKNVNNE